MRRSWAFVLLLVVGFGGDATSALLPAAAPPAGPSAAEIDRLVKQLGDEEFDRREAASQRLSRIGEPALTHLRRAERDPDLEVRKRAATLVRLIRGRLDRTDYPSEAPPKGAVILFAGKALDAWEGRGGKARPDWKLLAGVMEARGGDLVTKRSFTGRFRLHVEFRVPHKPQARGQARGNSGVFVQGRYEIQILDSYGFAADRSSCGSVYGQIAPSANVCKAPLTWQSFDVEFTAPVYKDNKKVKAARLSVLHNGVKIHDDVALSRPTAGGLPGDEWQPGPILLQDHGDPVQFRNVWLLPLPAR
jgi:hypothetical protein